MKKITVLLLVVLTMLSVSCTRYIGSNSGNGEGGAYIVLAPDSKKATIKQMKTVKSTLRHNFDNAGYTEATISINYFNKHITVEIPGVEDVENMEEIIFKKSTLNFVDSDGNILLDGTHIKNAQKKFGKLSDLSERENYVELTFNKEGVQKFADATKAVANKEPGQNYISIMLDQNEISRPSVSPEYATEGINSETAVISGEFTAETAEELANIINAGILPFDLKIVKMGIR